MSDEERMNEKAKEARRAYWHARMEAKGQICDDYCKYPDEYGLAGFDDMIAEKCEDCPLGRL